MKPNACYSVRLYSLRDGPPSEGRLIVEEYNPGATELLNTVVDKEAIRTLAEDIAAHPAMRKEQRELASLKEEVSRLREIVAAVGGGWDPKSGLLHVPKLCRSMSCRCFCGCHKSVVMEKS